MAWQRALREQGVLWTPPRTSSLASRTSSLAYRSSSLASESRTPPIMALDDVGAVAHPLAALSSAEQQLAAPGPHPPLVASPSLQLLATTAVQGAGVEQSVQQPNPQPLSLSALWTPPPSPHLRAPSGWLMPSPLPLSLFDTPPPRRSSSVVPLLAPLPPSVPTSGLTSASTLPLERSSSAPALPSVASPVHPPSDEFVRLVEVRNRKKCAVSRSLSLLDAGTAMVAALVQREKADANDGRQWRSANTYKRSDFSFDTVLQLMAMTRCRDWNHFNGSRHAVSQLECDGRLTPDGVSASATRSTSAARIARCAAAV